MDSMYLAAAATASGRTACLRFASGEHHELGRHGRRRRCLLLLLGASERRWRHRLLLGRLGRRLAALLLEGHLLPEGLVLRQQVCLLQDDLLQLRVGGRLLLLQVLERDDHLPQVRLFVIGVLEAIVARRRGCRRRCPARAGAPTL